MIAIRVHTAVKEKVKLFLCRPYAVTGIVLFLSGLIWLFSFSHQYDILAWKFIVSDMEVRAGTLTNIRSTDYVEKRGHVIEYDYVFYANGQWIAGKSFGVNVPGNAGDKVLIEYTSSNPDVSRMIGLRSAPFGFWFFLSMCIVPVIGLAGILISLQKTRAIIQTLRAGMMLNSKLLCRKIPLINKRKRTIRLEYIYNKGGKSFRTIFLTMFPEKFKEEEKVIVSVKKHRHAVLLNALPESIRWKIRNVRTHPIYADLEFRNN